MRYNLLALSHQTAKNVQLSPRAAQFLLALVLNISSRPGVPRWPMPAAGLAFIRDYSQHSQSSRISGICSSRTPPPPHPADRGYRFYSSALAGPRSVPRRRPAESPFARDARTPALPKMFSLPSPISSPARRGLSHSPAMSADGSSRKSIRPLSSQVLGWSRCRRANIPQGDRRGEEIDAHALRMPPL